MRVGKPEYFEEPLNAAVFAPFAVQGIEHRVGLGRFQLRGELARRVYFNDVIAGGPQRSRAGRA